MKRSTIAVFPPSFYQEKRTLFGALEDIFEATFRPCQGDEISIHHPALLWNPPEEVLDPALRTGAQRLVWQTCPSKSRPAQTGTVVFADQPSLDVSIRGQRIEETEPIALGCVDVLS